ncbi:MAG: ParM/StbA family protein [Chloroflexota bacterium]
MTMNNNIIKAGWDPGYDANKFARIHNGETVTYTLPSSVGEANRGKKDGLTLAGVVKGPYNVRRPFSVVFEGMEFLVGPNVTHYTKPIDRMDFNRFTDSPELRATFYAGIYRIINGGAHRVALAIALPVVVIQDKDEAARVSRGIRNWLLGEHLFSVDGVETALTITTIRAKVPQPVASWFDWGMNTSGQWVKGIEAQKAPTLIVDQGYNTLDVLVVEEGRISERISEGDTLGMRRAAEQLIRTIKHKYGPELELRQASDLVRAVVNGQKAKTYVSGDLINVTPEAKRSLQSLETDVYNFLDRTVGMETARAYNILLTGGGVLGLSSMLLRQFPKATMMHEPVLANARGLAKLANRPGFLE